jgi:hypothetical protein
MIQKFAAGKITEFKKKKNINNLYE